ncbi:MAG: Rne/Rng family ribonuclease [Acidobacteriota bacterium]|nr:MAG: Rne/Rng family ribonuclease [Acidobacteriota bacterium]
MPKELIVSATSLETKLAIVEDDQVTEIFIERDKSKGTLGNIYKGRVTRVLPGMQAAFVDIGQERNAFLYVSDFFEDYEEIEEIFPERRQASDEYVEEDVGEKKPGRGRRTRKPPRKQAPTQKGSPGESERGPQPAEKAPAGPEKKAPPLPAPAGLVAKILPAELPMPPGMRRPPRSRQMDDQDFELAGILPDDLGRRESARQSKPPQRTRRRRKARIEPDTDIQTFPLGRSSRRSKSRRKNGSSSPVPLIGDLLKEGQEILVQVAKEPIAKKGARITSHIVLPGRFLVFMPTVDHVGVSRRIESAKERQRLRDIVQGLRGDVHRGFIVRTAGEDKTEAELRQDMVYLTRVWEQILSKVERSSAPALIHSELDLVQRVIRDYVSDDYSAIRVDDEHEYERIVEFINNFNPSMVRKVRLYNKRVPIFDEFGINPEVERALKSKVWLKNGGYIVINQTEALVAIDVNTGKYVGRTNSLEDTITRTNLDAAREVTRQIRLRDLGGIIIVDFIDMNEARNQQRVLEAVQQELRRDKSPSKVLPFNEFGLVAITRKRVKQSLERTLCQPCPSCEGTGMSKSPRTVCYTIHAEVKRALPAMGDSTELIIRCHPDVGKALRETEKAVAREIKEMTKKEVTIRIDPLIAMEKFDLVEV